MNLYQIRNKMLSGISIQDMKLKVTFYARVSTDKDEQIHSLESQVSYFEDYIKKNSNWSFISGYIDEGISGTSIKKRENFIQMIKDAKDNKFDLILTKEISRFSRNTIDSIKYTQDLLQYGVGVYFLNDNINTIFPDSELRLTIMASVAQDEVRKLSERVSFGMKRSIEKGVVLGCSNIYGYNKFKGRLIIDEPQAEMIRFIYDNYANTSISLTSLSRLLFKNNYLNTKGNKVDIMVIQRIIANPKYKGYYCGNKTKIVDYRTKLKQKLNQSDWKVYKDFENVPPLVSEELWERANKKLKKIKDSFRNRNQDTKVFQNRYTYSGKIFCKTHDSSYHRSSSGARSKNPAWECSIYRKKGIKGCSNSKLFEYQLDKFFNNFINIDSEIISNLLGYYKLYLDKNDLNISKKISNIEIKKNKLLDLYIESKISKKDFLIKKEELEHEVKENINKEKQINKLDIIKSELIKSSNLCFNEIFNSLIDKIIVEREDSKSKLEIKFKSNNVLYAISDKKGHNFHLTDYYTTNNSSKCSD